MPRRLLAAVLTSIVAALTLASPAHAADYYRYWSFFTVENGTYVYSQVGVGVVKPSDGSMLAFRYAAPADYNKPDEPRIDLGTVTFDSVCGDTAAVDGQKRVAVIADFGVSDDAEGATVPDPFARCAQVPTKSTAFQVMQKIAQIRSTNLSGPFICAIDAYPASGCGEAKVKTATPANEGFVTIATDQPAEAKDDSNNEVLYAGIAATVVVLLGGGWLLSRRNKTAA
jgi:hypothetical protein